MKLERSKVLQPGLDEQQQKPASAGKWNPDKFEAKQQPFLFRMLRIVTLIKALCIGALSTVGFAGDAKSFLAAEDSIEKRGKSVHTRAAGESSNSGDGNSQSRVVVNPFKSFPSKLKRLLQEWPPYVVARETRNSLRRLKDQRAIQMQASLQPNGTPKGNVLVSYFPEPILLSQRGVPIPNSHSRDWESFLIAKTFQDLGYAVDVIHWQNGNFQPKKPYSVLVDVRWNLQRLAPVVSQANPKCIKIEHIDTSHIVFHNAAEAKRLLGVQQRRGVTLLPRRFESPNLAIEHADCATIIGNQFTMKTFRYAKKPLYPVPVIPSTCYPWPEGKDFEACRKNFLWFGSGGLVHKGLDLVLEVFASMPDHRLTVCGPLDGDPDFVEAYYKELYQTPNIKTLGWVDIDGSAFKEVCRDSAALVYPSCSEGQCGGVVAAMHAGVIPVISCESGVDVNDFGILLSTCSLKEIESAVRTISSSPGKHLEEMARSAWTYARKNNTREKFAEEYRKAIENILATAPGIETQAVEKPSNKPLPA